MLLAPLLALLATSVSVSASPLTEIKRTEYYARARALSTGGIPSIRTVVNGTYVRASEFDRCPPVKRRPVPSHVENVRPDDFTVVMALGDSITAAMFAKSQTVLDLNEFRGVSYATGSDAGAITLPNLMGRYTPNIGGSKGKHLVTLCGGGGGLCTPHLDFATDGLNAAISGAHASNLPWEAATFLVPQYHRLAKDAKDGWAYLNVMIGPNDMCQYCAAADFGIGNADEYARSLKAAVEQVRAVVPRLIVNVLGTFHVSDIFAKTFNEPYCKPKIPLIGSLIPHISIECPCVLLPGPVGDLKRAKMDELSAAYNEAVKKLVREWEAEKSSTFAAIFQPADILNIKNLPIEALSPADCFHPSEVAHQRIATGIWNRLVAKPEQKASETLWEEENWVRCLEDGDRIQVRGTA